MTTHTLFIASSSLLLPPLCAPLFLLLSCDWSMVDKSSNQPSEVGPMRWLDKGGKPSDTRLKAPFYPAQDSSPRSTQPTLLTKRRSPPHPYPLFRLCNSILYLSTPWRSVEWYSLSPCVASWTLYINRTTVFCLSFYCFFFVCAWHAVQPNNLKKICFFRFSYRQEGKYSL
jgi:hypothetical protein